MVGVTLAAPTSRRQAAELKYALPMQARKFPNILAIFLRSNFRAVCLQQRDFVSAERKFPPFPVQQQ
jgi:hypothetical protein